MPDRYVADAARYASEDLWAGHADYQTRGSLRADINHEIQIREMMRADAHVAAGIPPRSLDDGSLTTAQIEQALLAFRAMPGGAATYRSAIGWAA